MCLYTLKGFSLMAEHMTFNHYRMGSNTVGLTTAIG